VRRRGGADALHAARKARAGLAPEVGITKVLVELIDDKDEVLANWLTNQLTSLRRRLRRRSQLLLAKTARSPVASLWDSPAGVVPALSRSALRGAPDRRETDVGRHTFSKDDIIGFARQSTRSRSISTRKLPRPHCSAAMRVRLGRTAIVLHSRRHHDAAKGQRGGAGAGRDLASLRAFAPASAICVGRNRCSSATTVEYRARVSEKTDLNRVRIAACWRARVQGRNQHGDIVFAVTSQMLVQRRAEMARADQRCGSWLPLA